MARVELSFFGYNRNDKPLDDLEDRFTCHICFKSLLPDERVTTLKSSAPAHLKCFNQNVCEIGIEDAPTEIVRISVLGISILFPAFARNFASSILLKRAVYTNIAKKCAKTEVGKVFFTFFLSAIGDLFKDAQVLEDDTRRLLYHLKNNILKGGPFTLDDLADFLSPINLKAFIILGKGLVSGDQSLIAKGQNLLFPEISPLCPKGLEAQLGLVHLLTALGSLAYYSTSEEFFPDLLERVDLKFCSNHITRLKGLTMEGKRVYFKELTPNSRDMLHSLLYRDDPTSVQIKWLLTSNLLK